jgi:hypothetical protein
MFGEIHGIFIFYPEYLDCAESAHKQSAIAFDSMALDPEGRILERY